MTCNLKTQSPELYLSLFLSGRQSVKKIFLIFPSSRLITCLAPLIWFPRSCRCRRISTLIILMGITCLTVNICTSLVAFQDKWTPHSGVFLLNCSGQGSPHIFSCRLLWINPERTAGIFIYLFFWLWLWVFYSVQQSSCVCCTKWRIYWGFFSFFLRVIYVSLFHYWTHQLCRTGTLNIVFHCSFSQ